MPHPTKSHGFVKFCFVGAIGILALLTFFVARTADERGWDNYLHLMRNGANSEATIVRTVPWADCLAEYEFTIGGRSYSGTESQCNVTVGQKVTVTFLVTDPSQSCLGHAGRRLADEVVSFFFGGLTFPSLS